MKKSLKGKVVVITRSVKKNDPWIIHLKKQGAISYSFPTIEITPKTLTPAREKILKNISDFDWVIFTSAAGIRSLKELADAAAKKPKTSAIGISPRRMPKIAVVGDATARAVRAMGYRVAFQPSEASATALAFQLEPVQGRSILWLRSMIAGRDLHDILNARGASITDLPIYNTSPRLDPDPKFEKLLAAGRVDFLTFASPSAVRGFFNRLRSSKLQSKARALPAIAIGPSVTAALKKTGFKDIREAKEAGIEEVMMAGV